MFQAIERQVVAEFAGDDISQKPRTGQTLLDGLRSLGCRLDLRIEDLGLALPAGVLEPDVLEDLERRRHIFQLLADLLADAVPEIPTTRALLLLFRQVMLDGDARQMGREHCPAMLMPIAYAAGGELLPRLLFDTHLVQWHALDAQAKEQQLPGIKPPEVLIARAVEPAEQRVEFEIGRAHV